MTTVESVTSQPLLRLTDKRHQHVDESSNARPKYRLKYISITFQQTILASIKSLIKIISKDKSHPIRMAFI